MKIIVTVALLAVTTHAASSLRQNIKAVNPNPELELRTLMDAQLSSKVNGLYQV